jgi:LacI family transcriptional regulator
MTRLAKRATIHDVARHAGVSSRAVTRVTRGLFAEVNVEVRRRIEATISDLRYVPTPDAQTLSSGLSRRVALLIDNPNPEYVMRVQEGVLAGLAGSDHPLLLHACSADAPDLLEQLRVLIGRLKLFGVILVPPFSNDARLPEHLEALGCRYVRITATPSGKPEHTVRNEDRLGARLAGRRLLELGHRRLAMICGPETFASTGERRLGFGEALAEYGLNPGAARFLAGGYTFESGQAAAEALLSEKDLPTGVFASNDEMAAGVLHTALRRGLSIPGDLSLIGFDGLTVAGLTYPQLSTVRMPIHESAALAARRLIAAPGEARVTPLPQPELIVRASCAPPGSGKSTPH